LPRIPNVRRHKEFLVVDLTIILDRDFGGIRHGFIGSDGVVIGDVQISDFVEDDGEAQKVAFVAVPCALL